MKRAVALLFAACLIAVPAAVAVPPVGQHDNGFSKSDERYLDTYAECWKALGAECGRNIVDDGLAPAGAPASDARIADSTATMERWLHPPKPEPVSMPASSSSDTVAASSPAPSSVATSSSGCPSSMAPESGSAGYGAVNSSSGAYGCYQIMPSTSAAYGCDMSSPAGQDECAARICADVGSSAWAASGASPC